MHLRPLGFVLVLLGACWIATVPQVAQGANLLEVYEAAKENDPGISGSAAALSARREAMPQARASLLPNVSAGGSYQTNRRDAGVGTETFTSRGAQIQLTQPIFNAERWFTFQGARHRVDQAELEYQAQRQALIVDVAQAYLNILRAEDLLESTRAEEAAVNRQLEQVEQRFDVGLVAITDVLESTAVYDNTLVRLIQAEGDHGTFFETLRTLTGTSYLELGKLSPDLPIEPPDPDSEDDWVELALENNPLVQSAREQLKAAQRDVRARQAGHLPVLNLTAGYNYSSTDGTDFFGGRNETAQAGVQLQIPIFQGGATTSRVREASYREIEAKEQLREREYAVTRDTRNLYRNVMTDVQRVRARERSIRSSESALEATETGYEVGTRNIVEVLQAQQRLYQAQFDYADSRYNYVLNMLRLLQSAGILGDEHLAYINDYIEPDRVVPRRGVTSGYHREPAIDLDVENLAP